jgi:uncharacterized repeat protein (TIGR01451 family)
VLPGGTPPTTYTITAKYNAAGNFATSTDNTHTLTVKSNPTLTIGKSHTGTFVETQTGGEWDLTVSNAAGSSATSGTTTVSDTLPSGFTVHDFSTTPASWTCSGAGTQTASCSSTSVVNGGSSFSTIKMIVTVPANIAALTVSNTARAYGGGDPVHTNLGSAAVSNADSVSITPLTNAVSVTPNSGSGLGPQTFMAIYHDLAGPSDL